jgi:probable phosphoglycerate mutase
VGARADRVIARALAASGNVLLVSSGHILRVLAARWLRIDSGAGRYFLLGTASLSILDHEHHNAAEPVIRLWNETHEVA